MLGNLDIKLEKKKLVCLVYIVNWNIELSDLWAVSCELWWWEVREVSTREGPLGWCLYWAWWVQTGYPTLPLIVPPRPPSLPPLLIRDGAGGRGRGGRKILCQPVQVFVWAKWKNVGINELSFKSWAITVWQRCQKITGVFPLPADQTGTDELSISDVLVQQAASQTK